MAGITVGATKTFGKVIASGPTDIAIDNLADRTDAIATAIVDEVNEASGGNVHCYPVVVRAYDLHDEVAGFRHALQNPTDPEQQTKASKWRRASKERRASKWKMHLSVASRILTLLRFESEAVRSVREGDSQAYRDLQEKFDSRDDLDLLRQLATKKVTWAELECQNKAILVRETLHKVFASLVLELLECVDVLCTTPAMSESETYQAFKGNAPAVVIDEAGNINRADLYCVWGNTLRPCVLGGDSRQLRPAVMTRDDRDADGNPLNRFSADGAVSPLEFLAGAGMPVYRLNTQQRMACGMFDWVAEELYPDLPIRYGDGCDISNFPDGLALESFVQARFPDLTPSPPGKLLPTFVDCRNSRVFTDETAKSKRCPDQVKAALDFTADLVRDKKIDPRRIRFLTPYWANIYVVSRMRRKQEYKVLAPIPPPNTIEFFQGQEANIIILILGNHFPRPGAGFMADPNRLCVAMTRAKAGLVVFGDIYACGGKAPPEKEVIDASKLDQDKLRDDGEEKFLGQSATGRGKDKALYFSVEDSQGNMVIVKGLALRRIHVKFVRFGRVATIVIPRPEKSGPAGDHKPDDEKPDDEKPKKKKRKGKKKGRKDAKEEDGGSENEGKEDGESEDEGKEVGESEDEDKEDGGSEDEGKEAEEGLSTRDDVGH